MRINVKIESEDLRTGFEDFINVHMTFLHFDEKEVIEVVYDTKKALELGLSETEVDMFLSKIMKVINHEYDSDENKKVSHKALN